MEAGEDRERNTNEFHTILDLLSSILTSLLCASASPRFHQRLRRSPNEFQRELQLPIIRRGVPDRAEHASQCAIVNGSGHRSPGHRIQVRIGIQDRRGNAKHRMIKEIEGFEPELESKSFGKLGSLHCAKIECHKLGPTQGTAPGISKNFSICGE